MMDDYWGEGLVGKAYVDDGMQIPNLALKQTRLNKADRLGNVAGLVRSREPKEFDVWESSREHALFLSIIGITLEWYLNDMPRSSAAAEVDETVG